MDEFVQLLDLIVPFQGFASFLFPFLFDLIHDLEPIATEIPSRGRTVFLPRFQTNPTKVVFTFGAFHVITAFVLLNRGFTGRTWFRVGHQPQTIDGRFRLRVRVVQFLRSDLTDLLLPADPVRAGAWLVSLAQTFPAEEMIVAAVD